MMKKLPALVLVSIAASTLVACGSADDSSDTVASTAVDETSSTISDQTAPDQTRPDSTTTTAEDPVARVSVTVGVDSDPGRIEDVELGQQVELTLTNPDADDEFHLHGYDLGGDVTKKGESKTFSFTATEIGEFELESHVTGEVLVVVKVS
jgi:hypothetical protein